VRFAAITVCVVSQRVFIVVSIYVVIDSVRKLLDTPSYMQIEERMDDCLGKFSFARGEGSRIPFVGLQMVIKVGFWVLAGQRVRRT
jgi:hypothetical protein